ncbi:MAG: hypothetical protein WC670_03415 [Pseudolabrys sp.]|jgi:hypothetical protein
MQIELNKSIVNRLLGMPETGMGYQIVDLVLLDGRIVPNVKIFNCEVASLPDSYRNIGPSDVADILIVRSKPTSR